MTPVHRKWCVAIAAAVGIACVLAAVLLWRVRYRHDQRMINSCANHLIQLKGVMIGFVLREDQFPVESDTRKALAIMGSGGFVREGWLSSYGSACPEACLRDGSISYVYDADGLPTKLANKEAALVLFCPAESHQRFVKQSHALFGNGTRLRVESNLAMIEILKRELDRGRNGTVPYSTNALAKLERELTVRENYEEERALRRLR